MEMEMFLVSVALNSKVVLDVNGFGYAIRFASVWFSVMALVRQRFVCVPPAFTKVAGYEMIPPEDVNVGGAIT